MHGFSAFTLKAYFKSGSRVYHVYMRHARRPVQPRLASCTKPMGCAVLCAPNPCLDRWHAIFHCSKGPSVFDGLPLGFQNRIHWGTSLDGDVFNNPFHQVVTTLARCMMDRVNLFFIFPCDSNTCFFLFVILINFMLSLYYVRKFFVRQNRRNNEFVPKILSVEKICPPKFFPMRYVCVLFHSVIKNYCFHGSASSPCITYGRKGN